MKVNVSVSIDERTFEVMSALMKKKDMSKSSALNFLAWQGVLRLKELNASEGANESAEAIE